MNSLYCIYTKQKRQKNHQPATHAFMKDTAVPHIMALRASCEMVEERCGAIAPSAPITIPIDEMLAKPHSAYVAITMDRS